MSEGRSCPLAYRYSAESLCEDPRTVSEDVLYIIGGLYGNPWALDEIEQMALAEERQGHRVKLVFNGDFNWFNASDSLFRTINNRVLDHTVSLGNVDFELANPSAGAGCGCAYPILSIRAWWSGRTLSWSGFKGLPGHIRISSVACPCCRGIDA